MFRDKLVENFEEENFEVCGDLSWRMGIYLNENANVFLKGNEVHIDFVFAFEEFVHVK